MSLFYKYFPPAKANYKVKQDVRELINYYEMSYTNKVLTKEYIIGTAIITDNSFINNQQKLVIHQTKYTDKNDPYIQKKIHRNVLLATLPIGLFLENENKMVPSVWYYIVNQNGEIDIIEAFNSFGFLSKHYLLETDIPIIFGGEILIKRDNNVKTIIFNHLSGNYSKTLLDKHNHTLSKKTIENRLTRLVKKIFNIHIGFYKTKLWNYKEKWVNDIKLIYTHKRAFIVFGFPPKIEIDYWCNHFPNRILISQLNQPAILWKASKLLPKTTKKKLKPGELSKILKLHEIEYLC